MPRQSARLLAHTRPRAEIVRRTPGSRNRSSREPRSRHNLSVSLQNFHRCVVSGNSADGAAANSAGSTEKNILVIGLDAPGPDLLFSLGKRKSRCVLKNVTPKHSERVLDIHRAFAFNAGTAVVSKGQTILQRFLQPLVNTFEKLFLRVFPHDPVITCEQVPWRIQSKQSHGMKTFLAQLRGKDAVICQRVAIDFAWCPARQPARARLVIAEVHLLVAFVAVERAAPCLIRLILLSL